MDGKTDPIYIDRIEYEDRSSKSSANWVRSLTMNNNGGNGNASKSVAAMVFEGVQFTNEKAAGEEDSKKKKKLKTFEIHPRYV